MKQAVDREATSRFVQAGDVRLHCHEAGSGPVLLCLHGGAPGANGWINFGRNLPAFAAHFRTVIVDLPGYGRSDKPQVSGPRTGFYAEVMTRLLDALGVARAHLLGMATGGSVGLKMALAHPERVDRLVVVNAPGGLSMFQAAAPRPASHDYYLGDGPSMARMRANVERLVYDKSLVTDEVVRERYEASIDPDVMANSPEGRGGEAGRTLEPLWQDLHRIRAQTLVIWGRDNATLNYDHALFMLSRIPHARVHIHGRCGTWVPFEKADEFNRNVIGFLSADLAD